LKKEEENMSYEVAEVEAVVVVVMVMGVSNYFDCLKNIQLFVFPVLDSMKIVEAFQYLKV
jgi:hypothetical protein